jgi:uncharacterized protein (DUF433 family)
MSVAVVEYVEQTADGGWRVAGTRVSLDSIVHAYWDGRSPEAIVDEFPTLTAEQVYGALAYYLRHKSEIDHYLEQQAHRWQHVQGRSETQHTALLHRLRAAESQFACPQLALSRNGRLI